MCGMENTGIENKNPNESNPEAGEENSLQHTKPIFIDPQPVSEDASLEQTMPTRVEQEEAPAMSGLQDTASILLEQVTVGESPKGKPGTPPGPDGEAVKPKSGSGKGKSAVGRTSAKKGKAGKKTRRKGLSWLLYTFIGLLLLLLIGLVSAFAGYGSGIGVRKNAESTQVAQAADEQFLLAAQDMDQGFYDRARQRLEYVIQLNPNYPGATDKLSQILLAINTTATPTLEPESTATATPDIRGVQDQYNQAKQYVANSDWENAINTLLALRQADPNYQAVDVDGMLFLALRERGKKKTLNTDLEGGIYDLTLASHFGPLDTEAQALLNWSTLYITGASFWDIDWEQAVYYFQQVGPQMPNLMDGSKMTATERLRQALFEYGNSLAQQGQFCKAVTQYNQSLAIAPDAQVQQALGAVSKSCEGGGGGGGGTPQPTNTGKRHKATPTP